MKFPKPLFFTYTHHIPSHPTLISRLITAHGVLISHQKIINDDRAWASLSAEQRRVVLRLFNQTPASTLATVPEDLPNIPAQLLARSTALRTDLRLYQEDLAGGRMDPVRRRRAEAAAKERAEGRFDDWKERERELWWGQKMEGGG